MVGRPPGWARIFIADGRVRSGWRILLFAALFLIFLILGGGLLTLVPPADLRTALFWQGVVGLAAAIAAGAILLRRVDGRRVGALGFAWTGQAPRELLWGTMVGAASLGVVTAGLAAAGWLGYRPDEGTVGLYIATLATDFLIFAFAAAAEEAVFRGYPFQALVEGIGPVAATVLSSAAFALAHGANPNVGTIALINIFLAGVLLSAAYLRTRSLWFATAVHMGWNWSMASLFDLPVSGIAEFETPLYEPVLTGPDWVTGGAFGPEGGLGATVAFLVAILAVLKLPGLGEAPEMKALGPLVDRRA